MLAIDVLEDIETASKVWRAPADPFELPTDPYDVGLGVARQVEGDDRLARDWGDVRGERHARRAVR